jgi:CheY-like chemotaxis protein
MSAKILIVEDDKFLVNFLNDLLSEFEVQTAVDGIYGLKIARIRKPDLIVIDLGLPRMSGVQLMEKLEEDPVLKDVPVVLISGSFLKNYQGENIPEYHAKAVFTKPFEQDLFLDKIRNILAEKK